MTSDRSRDLPATPADDSPDWHARPADAVLGQLASGPGGLDDAEAARRLGIHGPNRLAQARKRSALRRFLTQFHNILLYVMLGSAAVTAALGHWIDTGVLVAAVILFGEIIQIFDLKNFNKTNDSGQHQQEVNIF